MVIESVLSSNKFLFWKGNKYECAHVIEKNFKLSFNFFHLDKTTIRY